MTQASYEDIQRRYSFVYSTIQRLRDEGISASVLSDATALQRLKAVGKMINRLTDQWFGMTYLQIAIAVIVAILGIVNTLTVSIADRKRELGVLRAVGALGNQIRHTIWLEAIVIGVLGLDLGLVVGSINLYCQLEIPERLHRHHPRLPLSVADRRRAGSRDSRLRARRRARPGRVRRARQSRGGFGI
jgi:hypothetical protein